MTIQRTYEPGDKGSDMHDESRNLNPTPEARVAMIIWGKEYSEQRGGSMDFWDKLSPSRKKRCEIVVEQLRSTS